MEIHYSVEDIEEYLEFEDPEGSMLAHREQLGLPPPIPLVEPWELGPPVLIRDDPAWPRTGPAAWSTPTKPSGRGGIDQEDDIANLIAAEWFDEFKGLIADELEDHGEHGVHHPEGPAEDADPPRAMRQSDRAVSPDPGDVTVDRVGALARGRTSAAPGLGRPGPGAGPLGPWRSLDSSDGRVGGPAPEAAIPPARDLRIYG